MHIKNVILSLATVGQIVLSAPNPSVANSFDIYSYINASAFSAIPTNKSLSAEFIDLQDLPIQHINAFDSGINYLVDTILQGLPLGQVISYRPILVSPQYQNVAYALQIMFRTESVTKQPQYGITTAFFPKKVIPGSIVSYQMAEDATASKCAPSQITELGLFRDPVVDGYLSLGFVVNMPDHEGVDGSFMAGIKQGKVTLDSLKAFTKVIKLLPFGPILGKTASNPKIALAGYSGGAFASIHAANLASSYAPEISSNIKALSVGGLTVNIQSSFSKTNGGAFSGYVAAGLAGIAKEYKDFANKVISNLTPEGTKNMKNLLDLCAPDILNRYAYVDIRTWFNNSDVVFNDEAINAENSILSHPFTYPVYIYQAIDDDITNIGDVDAYVDGLCKDGNQVRYLRDNAAGPHPHVTEASQMVPSAEWLRSYLQVDDVRVAYCQSWQDATSS